MHFLSPDSSHITTVQVLTRQVMQCSRPLPLAIVMQMLIFQCSHYIWCSFIAGQYDARYWYVISVCLSVCLSYDVIESKQLQVQFVELNQRYIVPRKLPH